MEDMTIPEKPWTNRQIRELRHVIAEGGDSIDGLSYPQVSVWYGDMLAEITERVEHMDLSGLDARDVRVSSRVKTIETLRDKLKRDPAMQIPRVRDIMGVRIAAYMTLGTQDGIVDRLAAILPVFKVSDMRSQPHSGYRAVHVILKLGNGVFCEVQVRTMLQDSWANCYELAGDIYGRGIRYGGGPDHEDGGIVGMLLGMSGSVRSVEESVNAMGFTGISRICVNGMSDTLHSAWRLLYDNRDALKSGRPILPSE
ncbi:RelA/SpoT domain-containing protein [Bifidobacterium myosotis]|uniref:RelA/SpoT domain-containing protein n=1 Tax=Bifidobacterium myosotis TaxID=1630166 RepID=A0A5M9ZI83_9BIFI|nr:RelA/SpoT domain-containing protein [Bifidobacterium myosotis]KAA8827185.1 hypothetical protein EMO91_09030 [Bifidobacterium myosotis]